MRFLAAPGGGLRVNRDHRPAHRGPQLGRGLASSGGQDPRLDRACVLVGQDPGQVGDEACFGIVDGPFVERAGGGGQPESEIQGQVEVGAGRLAGQGQRGRYLITDEFAQLGRELPCRGGSGPLGRAAARELGDHRQRARAAPRLQPAPGPNHADQLVVVQLGQAAIAGDRIG